jgi:hypothetical protein
MKQAGIAQLVEHNLAKVGVASSSLVSRSRETDLCRFFVSENHVEPLNGLSVLSQSSIFMIFKERYGCVAEW